MPEGDTIYRMARRLSEALVGEIVDSVGGSHRAVTSYGRRLIGRSVETVHNRGKHLIINFSDGWSARSHLRMSGSWDVYGLDQRWGKDPGSARLVITTTEHVAVCFAAPDIEIKPSRLIEEGLAYLGPDLTGDEFDADEATRRLLASRSENLADALLDQSVMAGIGNVYKSELAFIAGTLPSTDPASLSVDLATGLVAGARRLLMLNRARGARMTTGDQRRPLFVYGRHRQGCLRCRNPIQTSKLGDMARSTYWCGKCQD